MSAEDLKTAPASKTHAKEGAPKQKQKAAAGGYRVQLGSFKTEKEATSSWAVVKKKYPSLLGNLQSSIERKDLGSKGIFYRLQAGTISKESEARLLCKKLIEEKQGCIIVSN